MKFLIILLALIPIFGTAGQTQPEEKVGILLCLTGDCAQWGQASLNGVTLAIEEINARGGLQGRELVAQIEDSRETNLSNTISAFRRLASDPDIKLVVGPTWTRAGMALAPLAAKANLLLITPSLAVSDFSRSADNIFNTMPSEDVMTHALAEFAVHRGWERAAIFASQHAADLTQGRLFESRLKELGGTVSLFVDPLPGTPDLKIEAARIQKSRPNAVYISNWWGVAPKVLRTSGYTGPILTRQMDPQRLEAAGNFLDGAYFPRFPEVSADFAAKYRKRFKAAPPLHAATAYDIVQLYADIRDKTSTNTIDLLKSLFAKANFEGSSGLIRFGPDRTILSRKVEIAQVRETYLDGPALKW